VNDAGSASYKAALKETRRAHLLAYLRSGGAEGHVVDGRASGAHLFGTTCLIRYTGRKSGRTYVTPLTYADRGGEVIVVGSAGDAAHPGWYLNLVAAETVDFQIATQAFRATWREPQGAERRKLWDFMVDCYPFYARLQAPKARLFPIVPMKPVAAIPVFREEDMGGDE
jgi:deazaflavin-dependent oxidoreductase (nitroreductase family)